MFEAWGRICDVPVISRTTLGCSCSTDRGMCFSLYAKPLMITFAILEACRRDTQDVHLGDNLVYRRALGTFQTGERGTEKRGLGGLYPSVARLPQSRIIR